MKKFKQRQVLITSGCSFSECESRWINTWPAYLTNQLNYNQAVHLGLGSQGNGMISRKVLHAIHQQLKTSKAEDLLVGIMWSGPSRHEQYVSSRVNFDRNIDGWMDNPTSVVDNDQGGWIIYNAHWTIPQAKNYYRNLEI